MRRVIKRLVVANRGEIAIRVLSTARELGLYTIAIYTADDPNHALYADEAVLLDSPSDFSDAFKLTSICLDSEADSVHPAYGFLSESAEFCEMLEKAGILFVGPSSAVLRHVSEKTTARNVAEANHVPVLPALREAITDLDKALPFIERIGFPVMIKAVDGGGGRGIRLITGPEDLKQGFTRACGESPSGRVFLEKAAVEGYRHVEVQVLGDQYGEVRHLWERECSIQRRFQKVVELAPSTIQNRELVNDVIQSALIMAKAIKYSSLGTFEFLVHESRPEFYFLEVNPRLQVEHTVSELIAKVDIVQLQLLLIQGVPLAEVGFPSDGPSTKEVPSDFAIQLRITSEDASKGFSLSMGKVTQFHGPRGPGVRVDTHLSSMWPTTVGASFDSLLAKVIVSASSFEGARQKALRALHDTVIKGVKTNIDVLLGILSSTDFQEMKCDTRWLETKLPDIIAAGTTLAAGGINSRASKLGIEALSSGTSIESLNNATHLFKKGDSFKLLLEEHPTTSKTTPEEHLLVWNRIIENDFPSLVRGDITWTSASNASMSKKYTASLLSTQSNTVASSRHRMGDAANGGHIILPFPGQFVELLVDVGDEVLKGDLLCVVRQMKMELEVLAPFDCTVSWVCDVSEGETVNEGTLICEVKQCIEGRRRSGVPSKL